MKKLISVLLAVSALALSTTAFASSAAETFADKPVFREGDVITFEADASNLTLISSKVGAEANNSTIQYVDETSNSTISYKVRDLDEGDYQIAIKSGDSTPVTYNYTVADFDLIAANGNYIAGQNGDTVFYAAFAQVKGAKFADVVNAVGFEFNNKEVPGAIAASVLDDMADELDGAKIAVYGVTMNGVVDVANITPEAVEK